MAGTYVLVWTFSRETTIRVGALGERAFAPGHYVYVGSAFGPGGFSRVDRHRELARGDRDVRHWHIDYLLGSPETRLEAVATFPGVDRECSLARSLPGAPVSDVGASDCDCPAHVLAVPDHEALCERLEEEGGELDRLTDAGRDER